MPLTIPDEELQRAGLNERDALIEFACMLFDREKLSLNGAARLARMERQEFEAELAERKIPIYRPTVKDLREEMEAFKRLGI